MSLISDLTTLSNNPYEDDNGPWRWYVIDHIPAIQANSTTAMVDATYIAKYRYDIEWFLRDQNVGPEFAWIFRLINNISSGLSFNQPGVYYIPTSSYIDQLHEKWSAVSIVRTGK